MSKTLTSSACSPFSLQFFMITFLIKFQEDGGNYIKLFFSKNLDIFYLFYRVCEIVKQIFIVAVNHGNLETL